MPLTFLIVLTAAHFENMNLVVLAVREHHGFHRCTGHQGCADFDFRAVADCQNLIDHNFLANIRSDLFYFDFFAG